MTVADLAARCAELGAPQLTAQALYKLEGQRESASRRPRPVTVDELLTLGLALNVYPVHLLVPPDDYEAPYPVTATVTEPNCRVRGWIRGLFPLRRFPGSATSATSGLRCRRTSSRPCSKASASPAEDGHHGRSP